MSAMHTRPLFAGEQRHWARLQIVADPGDLNLLQVYRFAGSPGDLGLETRTRKLLERQSTLRTGYRLDSDGGQVAEIHDCGDLRLPLTALDASCEDEALGLVERLRREPFDLAVPPLLRLAAIRVSGDEFWTVLVVHHIVAEADSLRIIWRDLLGAVSASAASPHRSYEDFVADERCYADGPKYAADVAYWRAKADAIGRGILPASIPVTSTEDSEVRSIPIEPDQWSEFLGSARAAVATPFAVVLACVGQALYRLLGRPRITVGVSVSTRPIDGYDAVVGNFTNIVPVVLEPASGSLRQQAEIAMEAVMDGFEHARAPVQEILTAETGPDQSSIVQPLTMTATTYAEHDSLVMPGIGTARAVAVHRGPSKVGLSIYLAVRADSAVIHLVRGTHRQVVSMGPLVDEIRKQIAQLVLDGGATRG